MYKLKWYRFLLYLRDILMRYMARAVFLCYSIFSESGIFAGEALVL